MRWIWLEIDQRRRSYQNICAFTKLIPTVPIMTVYIKSKVCKKKNAKFISYNRCDTIKQFKMIVFVSILKECIFLNVIIPFSTSHLQQLPSTSLIPENCSNTVIFQRKVPPLCTWRVHQCKLQSTHLYARPFSSPSNRVYRMSLRPFILEQSNQDQGGVVRFFFLHCQFSRR